MIKTISVIHAVRLTTVSKQEYHLIIIYKSKHKSTFAVYFSSLICQCHRQMLVFTEIDLKNVHCVVFDIFRCSTLQLLNYLSIILDHLYWLKSPTTCISVFFIFRRYCTDILRKCRCLNIKHAT